MRFLVYITVTLLLLCGAYLTHLHSTSYIDFARIWYPLKVPYAKQHIACTGSVDLSPLLKQSISQLHIPSGQVALWRQGKSSDCYISWDGYWPWMPDASFNALQPSQAITSATRFRYASLTKPIVAAAIFAELPELATISLESRLVELIELPNLLNDPRILNISLEHLLNHQSGLKEENPRHGMFAYRRTSWCPNQLERLATIELEYEPGQGVSYANANYCLLNLVMQQLTGKSWVQLIEQHFQLEAYDIKAIPIEGYLADEARYIFVNDEFYNADYFDYVDLQSGLPALGLTGSATALVQLWAEKILPNKAVTKHLFDWQEAQAACISKQDSKCYFHGFEQYQSAKGSRLYLHTGKLFGSSAIIAISSKGNIFAWLGNDSLPTRHSHSLIELVDHLERLVDF